MNKLNSQQQCQICDKVFKTLNFLSIHIKNVHGENPDIFNCNVCNKNFSTQHKLNIHTNAVHQEQKKFKCESCGKSFSQAGHLKTHIHIVHEGFFSKFLKNKNE